MIHADYLDLIYFGLAHHGKNLTKHFIREAKNAALKNVDEDEYLHGLKKGMGEIWDNFNAGFAKDERRYLIRELPWEDYPKPDIDTFHQYFPTLTNDKYFEPELLTKQHLDSLNKAISEAEAVILANDVQATGKPKTPKQPKDLITFTWTGKQGKQTDLHKKMKGVFIDSKTRLADFWKVFEGVNVIQQVKWKNNNATNLLQFIYLLMENGYIAKPQRMNYNQIKACFCKADGSQFEENLNNLFYPIKNNFSNINSQLLHIFKSLK